MEEPGVVFFTTSFAASPGPTRTTTSAPQPKLPTAARTSERVGRPPDAQRSRRTARPPPPQRASRAPVVCERAGRAPRTSSRRRPRTRPTRSAPPAGSPPTAPIRPRPESVRRGVAPTPECRRRRPGRSGTGTPARAGVAGDPESHLRRKTRVLPSPVAGWAKAGLKAACQTVQLVAVRSACPWVKPVAR